MASQNTAADSIESTADLQDKVIASFKGFMHSYRLEPSGKIRKSAKYDIWHGFVQIGEDAFDLLCRRQDQERLLDLVARIYADQTDRQTVSRCLSEITRDWIIRGHSLDDQEALERSAVEFQERVHRSIKDFVVFMLVEGIKLPTNQKVQLARCELCPNSPESELAQVILQDRIGLASQPDSVSEEAPAWRQNSLARSMSSMARASSLSCTMSLPPRRSSASTNEPTSGSYTEVILLPLRGSSRLRPNGLFIGCASFLLMDGLGRIEKAPPVMGRAATWCAHHRPMRAGTERGWVVYRGMSGRQQRLIAHDGLTQVLIRPRNRCRGRRSRCGLMKVRLERPHFGRSLIHVLARGPNLGVDELFVASDNQRARTPMLAPGTPGVRRPRLVYCSIQPAYAALRRARLAE